MLEHSILKGLEVEDGAILLRGEQIGSFGWKSRIPEARMSPSIVPTSYSRISVWGSSPRDPGCTKARCEMSRKFSTARGADTLIPTLIALWTIRPAS